MVHKGTVATVRNDENIQATERCQDLYLGLLKKCLTAYLDREVLRPVKPYHTHRLRVTSHRLLKRVLDTQNLILARYEPFDEAYAINGGPALDRYTKALTMIGMNRLEQLRQFIVEVIQQSVPGNLIETGVWRGGATIFMRAVLKAYGDRTRIVWVADSFAGLPPPDLQRYPRDAGADFHTQQHMVVSLEQVKANFAMYDLLDDQVQFLPGWFRDTLPTAPIDQLSVMRLDADMYESTMDALRYLYPKLSPGGYVIVDDYSVPYCRAAVEDYRREQGITEPLEAATWPRWAVYWQRRG
jgi:predicted O-methyltransferase YrrM